MPYGYMDFENEIKNIIILKKSNAQNIEKHQDSEYQDSKRTRKNFGKSTLPMAL